MQSRIHSVTPVTETQHFQQRPQQQQQAEQHNGSERRSVVTRAPVSVASYSMNSTAKAIDMYDDVESMTHRQQADKVALHFSV